MGNTPTPQAQRVVDALSVHRCSCGKTYTRASWANLPPAAGGLYMHVPAGEDPVAEPAYTLECRNCSCGSTRSIYATEGDHHHGNEEDDQ